MNKMTEYNHVVILKFQKNTIFYVYSSERRAILLCYLAFFSYNES